MPTIDRYRQSLSGVTTHPDAEAIEAKHLIIAAAVPEDAVVRFIYADVTITRDLKDVCVFLAARDVEQLLGVAACQIVVEPWSRSPGHRRLDRCEQWMGKYQARAGERAVSISNTAADELLLLGATLRG